MTRTTTAPVALPLSINTELIDKNVDGNKSAFAVGWEAQLITLAELAKAIDAGYAFGPQFKDGRRLGTNFELCGFVAIDSDGGWSLRDALNDPFIQQYAALCYPTPSHGRDGVDRFRVVFVPETPIAAGEQYRAALLGLAKRFNTDERIADASRCFFGSRGSAPTIIGQLLPDEELKSLIRLGRDADQNRRTAKVSANETGDDERSATGSLRADVAIPDDLTIHLAHGGSGTIRTIPSRAAIHCPFHADKNPSAFTLRSKSGHPGLRCMSCRKTWWAEGVEPAKYNFYYYDDFAKELAAKGHKPGSSKEAVIINEQFLPEIEFRDGITLIKSPKGTGKTTALAGLVKKAKSVGQSVLLIGHRQVLLRELAARLGLECYLDDTNLGGEYGSPRPDYYAISVDSLPRRLRLPRPYDIVIVDECEQVFRHVTAKTVKDPYGVMTRLQSYIGDARGLYLSDADLNLVTLNFVFAERAKDKTVPVLMVLNTYITENRVCEMYGDDKELVVDLIRSVRAGKRVFVACNSKRRAKLLARVIMKELGASGRVLLVTAEEKVSQEVQDFLADIPNRYLQYRAVVASPAIGTGIDITFPNGAQQVDVVYGFFNSGINSHYDIDQQIGRVRNPGEVKVWVCSGRKNFEIELDAIKLDLTQTGDSHPAVKAFLRGVPVIDMDHPLLCLQATAYSAQRASHNRMKDYFMRHKELNGWTIRRIAPATTDETWGLKQQLARTQREIDEEFVGGVMNAAEIDEDRWKDHFDRRAAGEAISHLAKFEMVRFEIRHFYNDYVTTEIVEMDDYGRFREAVLRYESLHIHSQDQLRLLVSKWKAYTSKNGDLAGTLGKLPLRSTEAILLASGLIDESGLRSDKVITRDDLSGFLAYCDDRRITIERDLGVNLRNDRKHSPVKTLNLCLDQVGLRLAPLGKSRQGDSAIYRYQLDAVGIDFLRNLMVRRQDKSRSILPEVLQPPRPPARKKPANDNGNEDDGLLSWLNNG